MLCHVESNGKEWTQEEKCHIATTSSSLDSVQAELPVFPQRRDGFVIVKAEVVSAKFLFKLSNPV